MLETNPLEAVFTLPNEIFYPGASACACCMLFTLGKPHSEEKETFFGLYGGVFFIGMYLGSLFLMATVLIIYYKQISEGYDDKDRYQIMQKVGMSKKEVKGSIHSQILTVFFVPLLMAILHVTVAFKPITKLLLVFNLSFTN